MHRKTTLAAIALALLGIGGGFAVAESVNGGSMQQAADHSGTGVDFARVVQQSGATQAEIDRVDRLVQPVRLVVDGHRIPNYGIAMGILMKRRYFDLDTDAGVRSAMIGTMSGLALDSALYHSAQVDGITGPSGAEVKKAADDQTALAVRAKHSPFANQKAADQYYHSANFARAYVRDVIIKLEREKITHTGDFLTQAQSLRAHGVMLAWALKVFPTRVTVSGAMGISAHDLATVVS